MNSTITETQIPKFSLVLLMLLLALAPYAMSLRPYEAIYTTGVWSAKHSADPLYPQRLALILFGLLSAVISFGQFVWSFKHVRVDLIRVGSFAAVFLACAVVGWRSYPYWVTGVYQVHVGRCPSVDMDPKTLMPMVWIGDLWRLPVVLLYLLCFIAIPLLTVIAGIGLWQRRFVPAALTAFSVGIAMVFTLGFSPDYVVWLMD